MAANLPVQPSLPDIHALLTASENLTNPPNLIPLTTTISSEFLTPSSIYLKMAAHANASTKESATPTANGTANPSPDSKTTVPTFLFESATTTQTPSRYSFIGSHPHKTLTSGPNHGYPHDPLPRLASELAQFRVAHVPSLRLPPLTGGAVGYVGYDCVRYFEPRSRPRGKDGKEVEMRDVLGVPESWFGLFETVVAVDHFFQRVVVVTFLRVPEGYLTSNTGSDEKKLQELEKVYEAGKFHLLRILEVIQNPHIPLPAQDPLTPRTAKDYTSNIGREGYESHVRTLKHHITTGDIIQAVPSQRIARPTDLAPFNIYRRLRTVNPSPYMFFLDTGEFQIVGASPEVLVKEDEGRIITHPIAGTVRRGNSEAEDEVLAEQLRASVKDRAEHVMLVDLARNDVNRVCDPLTTRVDRLMIVQKFSHVQHLTSEVSGVLRKGKTRFDAFRSIFPAGTVSGAPKVKAMELISILEGETRGVYAGAVGYFGYNNVDPFDLVPTNASEPGSRGNRTAVEKEGAMDTCIALRTMLVKDSVVYLQAGGGIVFDSDPGEEYEETINKLSANMRTIEQMEGIVYAEQQQAAGKRGEGVGDGAVEAAGAGKVRGPEVIGLGGE